jgi:group I intron endonuclease
VHHVYVITHRESGRHYVGKTSQTNPLRRWKHHQNDAASKRRRCPLLHAAIRKYGPDSFSFQVVESFNSEAEALYFEAWWIEVLRSRVIGYGFNVYADGTGGAGHTVSEETRQKLRTANLGKTYSAEVRNKLSSMRRGKPLRPWTDEERARQSILAKERFASGRQKPINLGQRLPDAWRAKLCKPKTLTDEQRAANALRSQAQMRAQWSDPTYRARMQQTMSLVVRRGEQSASSKLSESDVREIRRMAKAGITQGRLADVFRVSQGQIWRIVHRKRWAHIDDQ